VSKDCDPINFLPYPRRIEEKDFPSLLHQRLQDDLNIIDNCANMRWEQIVNKLQHKGIRIHPQRNTFYLSRIDEQMVRERRVHKYCKDKKLTALVRFRVRNQTGEDLQFKEVVMEKTQTLLDLKKKHLNRRYGNSNQGRILFYEEGKEEEGVAFGEETLISTLNEQTVYVMFV